MYLQSAEPDRQDPGMPGCLNGDLALMYSDDLGHSWSAPRILPLPRCDFDNPNENIAKNLAYTGAIKDNIINIELLSYSLLEYLRDNYPAELKNRYKLENIEDLEGYELLEYIGRKRGFVISGGEIDTERAANMLMDELRSCKIGNIKLERVPN